MSWNWQDTDWPCFRYTGDTLAGREAVFLRQAGVVIGSMGHVSGAERDQFTVELLSTEAMTTSEIEGELLDRASVQSSMRREFGLDNERRRVRPAERGIAEMLADLYRRFDAPLDEITLFAWHRALLGGRTDLDTIGAWRSHAEPMQIVSGRRRKPRIHFEAPPSAAMANEMAAFLAWFNRTAPCGATPLPALARAGIAHLHFVSIHPFEDGNGRIGRAIAEKALAQGTGQPTLTALSRTILARRAAYYRELERASAGLQIDTWLDWFADTVLAAQADTQHRIAFLIGKTRLLDRLRGRLNARQEKALLRLLREGPEGFAGGLSAANYIAISATSPATARRDLAGLVTLGALTQTGQAKGRRYWLAALE